VYEEPAKREISTMSHARIAFALTALGLAACSSKSSSSSSKSESTGSGSDVYRVCASMNEGGRHKTEDDNGMGRKPEKDDDDKRKQRDLEALTSCMRDMEEVANASPDGFARIQRCVDDNPSAGGGCVYSVVQSDPNLQAAATKQEKRKEEEKKKKKADSILAWADMKSKPFSGKLKSYDGVVTNYTMQLPEAFSLPDDKADSLAFFEWKSPDPEIYISPSLHVSNGYGLPDLDTAVAMQGQLKHKVTKKEKLPDGYLIDSEDEDGKSVEVKVSKKSGDYGSVECEASLSSEELLAAKAKLVPWLEKACSSLTPKPGN
jgi:hypothetical protein